MRSIFFVDLAARQISTLAAQMTKPHDKPHFNVTAAIIRRDGRILITRRPDGTHLGGLWEFPGGKQEEGESLEECLVREIKEELGIAVMPEKRLFVREHEYQSRRVTLHFFMCLSSSDCPSRGLQGQETRWVTPEELAAYSFPPPDLSVIEYLTAKRAAP